MSENVIFTKIAIMCVVQFVRERQEIMPLQTCESYFLIFPKKICGVSVIRLGEASRPGPAASFFFGARIWLGTILG